MLIDQGVRIMQSQAELRRERLQWMRDEPHQKQHRHHKKHYNKKHNKHFSAQRKLTFDEDTASREYVAPPTILDGKEVPSLNPDDPVHAKRILQRKRHVAFGKNTVGYDEYIKLVPKHKRKKRSLDHPMTPDPTADISNRRWLGLVSAWRRSLHKYDPPGMDIPTHKQVTLNDSDLLRSRKPSKPLTEQEKEIYEATMKGLPVDFSQSVAVSSASNSTDTSVKDDDTLIDSKANNRPFEDTNEPMIFNNKDFSSCKWADLCDSDDDLL